MLEVAFLKAKDLAQVRLHLNQRALTGTGKSEPQVEEQGGYKNTVQKQRTEGKGNGGGQRNDAQ